MSKSSKFATKEDRAAYMREYRKKKKEEKMIQQNDDDDNVDDVPQPKSNFKEKFNKKIILRDQQLKKLKQAVDEEKQYNKSKYENKQLDDDDDVSDITEDVVPDKKTYDENELIYSSGMNNNDHDINWTNEPDLNEVAEEIDQQNDEVINTGVEEVKMSDDLRDFKEYMSTSHLLEEIKSLEEELKLTRDLLEKTEETVKILNSELVNSHKEMKKLKKHSYDPNDVNQYFERNKYVHVDPSDDVEAEEIEISKDQYEDLMNKFEKFGRDFKKRYMDYHGIKSIIDS